MQLQYMHLSQAYTSKRRILIQVLPASLWGPKTPSEFLLRSIILLPKTLRSLENAVCYRKDNPGGAQFLPSPCRITQKLVCCTVIQIGVKNVECGPSQKIKKPTPVPRHTDVFTNLSLMFYFFIRP